MQEKSVAFLAATGVCRTLTLSSDMPSKAFGSSTTAEVKSRPTLRVVSVMAIATSLYSWQVRSLPNLSSRAACRS